MPVQDNLAVGTVALFAGDLSSDRRSALLALGWLPCDGTALSAGDYPELYAAIGNSHGGNGTSFNVPQLANRFVRGVSGSSPEDPDSATRSAAAPGGATGNAVGSLQQSGTALPNTPWVLSTDPDHQHNYLHLSGDSHEAWGGSTYTEGRWPGGATTDAAGNHTHSISGGDPSTVPVSIALNWLIRAKPATASGTSPAGAIVGLGGSGNPATGWLVCDGLAQAMSAGNADLSSAIGFNFGGDGTTSFDLPDFRGRFMRGTSHSTKRDPDAASRLESQTGGATGDAVGSLQEYATANGQVPFVAAVGGAHAHTLAHVPINDHHIAWGASGPLAWNVQEWTSDSTATSPAGSHTHTLIGGDKETRPTNVYLNWAIAASDFADAPPIGSILPFAGDFTSITTQADLIEDGWFPCAGAKIRLSDAKGKALHAVIGNTFGCDKLNFYLPDLRGLFVVGAGASALGSVSAASQTGSPQNPFATTSPGDHTHTVPTGIPTDAHNIDVVAGCDTAEYNPSSPASDTQDSHKHTIIGGGDSESRPVNVNVDYIIRFR